MAPAPQKGLCGFMYNADQSDQTISKYIVHLNKSTESIVFFCKDSVDLASFTETIYVTEGVLKNTVLELLTCWTYMLPDFKNERFNW